eukprot:9478168-Pyramimonas_sp.AAC.1
MGELVRMKVGTPYSSDEADRPVCNDGTPAMYFLRKAPAGPGSCWVVYYEGGAMCSNDYDCTRRMETLFQYCTSSLNRITLNGTTILDIDETINPAYAHCNHVYVPYCSSDLWLGRSTEANPLRFNGHGIFRNVFQELIDTHGMDQASTVTVAGSSAGGLGAHPIVVRELDTDMRCPPKMEEQVKRSVVVRWLNT